MSISINDLMVVHVTDVRPSLRDGRLVMKTGGSSVSFEHGDNKIFMKKRDFSRPHRMTLHWSLNGVTRVAGFQYDKVTLYGIPARYAIVEPISALKDELWGGGFDDLYSLGDHTISQDGYIFVPEDEPDVDRLVEVANVVHYKGYVEGFTNDHMRDMIAFLLSIMKKPCMVINGLFLNEDILSRLYKLTFPSRWASLTDEQLMDDAEFIRYNKEMMTSQISGIVRLADKRIYVCKEATNQKIPTGAIFEDDNRGLIVISEEDLGKILRDSNYILPEYGVIHPVSILLTYEDKLKHSMEREEMLGTVNEIRKIIMEKKPTATSLDGLNQIMDRIRNRL